MERNGVGEGRKGRGKGREKGKLRPYSIFTVRLCEAYTHGIAVVILSVRPSVCPSVRPSVKRVYCDKTKAPSEKSPIMTNRKSTTSFPMSLR